MALVLTVVPKARPPAPRGAMVRLTHELLTWWLSLHISLSPLGYFARQHQAHFLYLICVRSFVTLLSSQPKLLLVSCFLFPISFHLPLTHNVYSLSAPVMAAGVSILSDLPYSMSGAYSGKISTEMETGRSALQHKNNPRKAACLILFCEATAQGCILAMI